eukprot:c14992_g2_i1 orf=443-772(-)
MAVVTNLRIFCKIYGCSPGCIDQGIHELTSHCAHTAHCLLHHKDFRFAPVGHTCAPLSPIDFLAKAVWQSLQTSGIFIRSMDALLGVVIKAYTRANFSLCPHSTLSLAS